MISERNVIAIKCCLNPNPIADHDQAAQNLLQCWKSGSEALQLKQDGNDHFRKKKFHAAIHKYTMVSPLYSALIKDVYFNMLSCIIIGNPSVSLAV
jgi:hypothetical protein